MDSISQQDYNNGKHVDPDKDHVQINEVTVNGHRPNWLVRTLHAIGRFINTPVGTTSEGGLSMDSEIGQGTPDKAKHTEDIGNIDGLFWMGKGAAAWEHLPSSLNVAEGFHKAGEAYEEVKEMTSDKEITEEHSGTAKPTNAHGQDTTVRLTTIKQGSFNTFQYIEDKDTTVKKSDVHKVNEISKKRIHDFNN